MSDFFADLKQSVRMLAKSPSFSIAAVAALTLGIAVNTAIFSVVNAVLLKPLTYPEPDRIVQFLSTSPNGNGPAASITKFHNWQQQSNVFQDVAAYDFGGPGFNLTGSVPEQVHGIHVTHDYFALFGAPVQVGRTFTPQEDLPNGGHVVVLSNGFWKRKFGGNPKIVGTEISLSGDSYTVVGVLGPNFETDPVSDMWIPFQFDPNSENQGHFFMAAGRLKPGITLDQANAQLKLAAQQYRRRYPDFNANNGFAVQPLRDSVVSGVRSSLLILLAAVGLVLLIACANVANLLLVRATGRKREFAIRIALGARRSHIIRQLLTESLLLSVTGGVLGLILGYAGVRWLLAINPGNIPRIGETGAGVGIDWRVLVFTLGVSLLTGVIFGLFPALGASRPDVNSTLKEGSNRAGTGFRQNKARSLLVISEVSLALILLVGSALLIRTFVALHAVDPGFNPHHVLTMYMSLTGDRFQKTAGVAQLVELGRERVNAIPGVEASASSCCLPLEGGFGLPFIVVGRSLGKDKQTGGAGWMSASPGYFSVFRIPVLRGRDFTETDTGTAPGVVLINQTMAKKFWPKEDPVGQQIIIGKGVGPQFDEPARQIVGVVGDIRDGGLNRDPRPLMIVPQAQVTDGMTALNSSIGPVAWIVRTRTDPRQMANAITEQLRQASNGFPVARVRPMEEVVVHSTAREDFNMLLLTIFGASALLLASIGIYGLMAYSAQQRTQEMGIRMALGADRSRIRGLVIWQGMRLALIGTALGIAGAFALAHLIASLLFGVKWWDPFAFIAVPIILTLTALLAVWIPAQRASRLNPMDALRTE
ncbi:ABC transporter permease [Edaphobacter sp. HDX4]|uniref:ABC transporter permease n=1 Tax=Edaphobacter sp. HDX4 TaxID=2794064 RepID=UPI002FE6B2F4